MSIFAARSPGSIAGMLLGVIGIVLCWGVGYVIGYSTGKWKAWVSFLFSTLLLCAVLFALVRYFSPDRGLDSEDGMGALCMFVPIAFFCYAGTAVGRPS